MHFVDLFSVSGPNFSEQRAIVISSRSADIRCMHHLQPIHQGPHASSFWISDFVGLDLTDVGRN